MNYLSAENLSKRYGEQILFEGVSFGVSQGQRAALVAKNGTGKTTLLNIIAGDDVPDAGDCRLRNGVRAAIVRQDPALDPDLTVLETIFFAREPRQDAIREYEDALERQADAPSEANEARLQAALETMEALDAWDFEAKVKQTLGRLKINRLNQPVGVLSGGQRKRVAMARALVSEPEFLILDEPTNHLDYEMIEWLEQYLTQSNLTLLLVSHDRYFLDRVCDVILELEPDGMYTYKGDYEYFLEKKAERTARESAEMDKARKYFSNELEWMRRQPKARGTKAKAREDRFYAAEDKVSGVRQEQELKLDVKTTRVGGKVLDFKKVSKSYGDLKILDHFNYTFKRGERVGIVGKNGAGKTTFLRLLMGEETPDAGKIEMGDTIVPGYFQQEGLSFKPNQRVIELVKTFAEVIQLSDGSKVSASQFLQHFQFDYNQQHSFVEHLSGGERRRLHLLTVLIKNPNLLILDEPTNDLDLMTLNILEEFLLHYDGCLIIVSHDRYFLDKLVTHLFVFEGDGVVQDFNGNYREWRESEKAKEAARRRAPKPEEAPAAKPEKDKPKKKLTFNEKREFGLLEGEIEKLEARKTEVEELLASGTDDYDRLQELTGELGRVMEEIDKKSERWLELSEYE